PGKFGGAAASAIIGGTASTLSGGKFANGALSGAFGYLFNQWAHSYSQQYDCIGTCHGNADTLGREMTPLQAAGLDAATTLVPYAGITRLIKIGGIFVKDVIELGKVRFGHTFTRHGEDATEFLINRARGSGQAQGQFLDNQAAARFIQDNLDKIGNGAVSLPLPKNFPARIINPGGTFSKPSSIRLVPGGKGVKTAYPEP
ncbi:hypothetical protein, partial [Thiolapillus sp.]